MKSCFFLYFQKHICQYYRMDCFCQTSNYHLFKIAPRFDPVDAFWDILRFGTFSRCGEVRELHPILSPWVGSNENILDCDEYPLTHWDLVLSSSDWQKQLGDGVVLAWYNNNIWDHLVTLDWIVVWIEYSTKECLFNKQITTWITSTFITPGKLELGWQLFNFVWTKLNVSRK